MPHMVKRALQRAVALTNRRGGINVQRRPKLFGKFVDGDTIAMKLVFLVSKPRGPRKHELGIVTGGQPLALSP